LEITSVDDPGRRNLPIRDGPPLLRWLAAAVVAAVTLFVVGAAFSVAVRLFAPGVEAQYKDNTALFRPWAGWTSTYMMLHPLGFGFVFAAVFLGLCRWSAFPRGVRGGLLYGAGVFAVGALPVYLLSYAAFQAPPEVMICWVGQSLTQYALAGAAVGLVAGGGVRRTG
jgi:hypothetical protein